MSDSGLIAGRFVRMRCPWCGADTYAVPGVAAMACATHARGWFGAAQPVRPVPGANNGLRMGQGGAVGWQHTPRRVVELEYVPPPSRLVLVVPRSMVAGDGAPRTVAALAGRTGGAALYGAVLCPLGKGDGFDRWVLAEWVLVKWPGGYATWKRVGRAKWVPVDRLRVPLTP